MMTLQDNQLDIFGGNNEVSISASNDELGKSENTSGLEINESADASYDLNEKSYEEAVAELEQVVARLESGEAALDESMELFQQGMKLADFCSKKLNSMEEKITKLMLQADGSFAEMPLEEPENGKV